MLTVEPGDAVPAIASSLRRQQKTPLEQIEFRPAKHLALQHLEAVDVAFDWAITPAQGDSGFDGVIVIAQSFGKPLQGHEGTLRCPGQPRIQLVGLVRAHELHKVLG